MFNRPTRALRLRQPVGNGMANEPDDVMAVQRRLGAQGLYTWDDDGPSGFIDSDLLAGIRKFQQGKGLAVDGWLAPGGETERNLNRPPDRTPDFNPFLEQAEPVDIFGEVGNGRASDEADVTGVKRALAALGLYQYDLTSDPSPFIDRAMLDGIKAFQQQNGLKVDGWLGRGGETQAAMNAALGRTVASESDAGPVGSAANDRLAAQTPGGNKQGVRNLLELFLRTVPQIVPKPEPPPASPKPAPMPIPPAPAPQPEREPKPAPPATTPELDPTVLPGGEPVPESTAKPVVPDDGRRDPFFDRLHIYLSEEVRKKHPGGRGGENAQRSIDVFLQRCIEIKNADYPHLGNVEHTGGGTLDGKGEEYMKERVIRDDSQPKTTLKDSSRADFSLGVRNSDGTIGPEAHGNSTSIRKDGSMTPDELRRYDNLVRKVGPELTAFIDKIGKWRNEDDIRRQSDAACRKLLNALDRELKKTEGAPAKGPVDAE